MTTEKRVAIITGASQGVGEGLVRPYRDRNYHPETIESLKPFAPLHRIGEVSDVVRAVMYLEDASFLTGEIVYVDGGHTAGH